MSMYDYERIKSNLSTKYIGQVFVQFDDLSSVHLKAKNISESCPNGMLVLCQTQGDVRLRNNKSWQSKSIDGILMSIILKETKSRDYSSEILQIATASVCEALLRLDDSVDCHIRWPNDVYLYDKKVASVFSEKIDKKDNNSLIISIYLNVSLQDEAVSGEFINIGTVTDIIKKVINKEDIISNILNKIEAYYVELIKTKVLGSSLDVFKKHNHIIGKEMGVRLINKKTIRKLKAIDINGLGEIVAVNYSPSKSSDGEVEQLKYGRDIIEWCVDEWVED